MFSSDFSTLSILALIVSIVKPKKILEIGTFCGIATAFLAKHTEDNVKIVSVEKFQESFNAAKSNLKHYCKLKKIKLVHDDAQKFIKEKTKNKFFDLIFVDGNKENYNDYFKSLQNNLRKNSVIVFDDIFMNGDIFNNKTINLKTCGIKKLLNTLKNTENYWFITLPIGNGILICLKK